MSTLTANAVRLPEHCEHKLPTSCRLTARPVCCACQDNRPHASSYSKYIDGVGFVQWGTRQERYCWPCKEFWDVRISVSGLQSSETRLPEVPDLTSFLEQWYDWHRGYRTIRLEDGSEQRQALVGESLSNCAHGYLPRSAEELRNGMQPGDRERIERGGRPQRPAAPIAPRLDDDFVVPEDERLFDEVSEPEGEGVDREPEAAETSPNSSPFQNRIGMLRQDIERNRNEIAVIRQAAAAEHRHFAELAGDSIPPSASTQSRSDDTGLTQPLRIAREHYQRVASLRRELQRMRVGIERVMTGLQGLQVEVPDSSEALDQLNQLNSNLSRYREAPLDIPELNNPEYQSPITGMFERAWRWHRQVQSDRMHAFSAQDASPDFQMPQPVDPTVHRGTSQVPYSQLMAEWRAARQQRLQAEAEDDGPSSLGLDAPGRPAAIENDEDFKIDNRCEVCLQQVANVATFPCGHMIMCQWCSDEVIPRHVSARNVPRDPTSKCPQCRRRIRNIYTVHVRLSKNYKQDDGDKEEKSSEQESTQPEIS